MKHGLYNNYNYWQQNYWQWLYMSVVVLIALTLYKQYTTTDNTTSTHREARPEIWHRSTYRFHPVMNGSSENSVFRVNAPKFWIITPKLLIVHHLFQHSHVPKQIRNRTISKTAWNGLNILSYGVRRVKQTVSICGLLHHISWLVFFLWHKHTYLYTNTQQLLERKQVKHIHYLFSSQHDTLQHSHTVQCTNKGDTNTVHTSKVNEI